MDNTEDESARICTAIPRSYPCSTCHASFLLSRAGGERGETALSSGLGDAGGGGRGREIDARGGSQWSQLVRDRLALPSFLLSLSLRALRLAGWCLCLCFAWTHDARSFHAEQRPACTALARCSSCVCVCVWAIFSQLAATFSCARLHPPSPPVIHYSVIQYNPSVAASRPRARQSPLIPPPQPNRSGSLRSQSQHREPRCARPSEPPQIDQHAHTFAVRRIYHPPLTRRAVVLALSRHGPPSSIPSGRATTPRPPSRVLEPDIPTAISHAHCPTADTNTLCGSLLTRSRSVSTRITWEERKSGTRPSRVATRTRYVQESVTQA